jgi:hypothetical protein
MIVELCHLATDLVAEMKQNEEMKLSSQDNKDFLNATHCTICKDVLETGEIRCRDHDHRTGEFRGATHQKCNINYFCNRFVPVVFHNLKGYDSHFIIKQAYAIAKEINNPTITAIPNSYEKNEFQYWFEFKVY